MRQVLPNLATRSLNAVGIPARDTGRQIWSGKAVLAGIDWAAGVSILGLTEGFEANKRKLREELVGGFAQAGIGLSTPDPSNWTEDSLDVMRDFGEIRRWVADRLDWRGECRYRPGLPSLRRNLARWGADKLVLVSVDLGPVEPEFDTSIVPMQVTKSGKAKMVWFQPSPYLTAAVFDARNGVALKVRRVTTGYIARGSGQAEVVRDLVRTLFEK